MPPQAPVRFEATIPPCDGAIRIHGDGGMRIMLDIAEEDVPSALFLTPLRGKILKVAVMAEKQPGKTYARSGQTIPAGKKRKPTWTP